MRYFNFFLFPDMKEAPNKNAIIQRLKEYYGLSTNAELADKLGVAQNTISGWIKRNSIDYDLVFSKCEEVDFNWLLSGTSTEHKSTETSSGIDPEEQQIINLGRAISIEQAVTEVKAEIALSRFLHKKFELNKYYDDNMYNELNAICSMVNDFSFEHSFNITYNQFKKDHDPESLLKAFGEIYSRGLEIYNILASHRGVISEIYARLLDFVGQQEFKTIVDNGGEENFIWYLDLFKADKKSGKE